MARLDQFAPALTLLGGDPGNAILLNGVLQTANLEIGVPGFPSQVPTPTSEFRFNKFTFGLFRLSAFLISARAPPVSAVLFLFWKEIDPWM